MVDLHWYYKRENDEELQYSIKKKNICVHMGLYLIIYPFK